MNLNVFLKSAFLFFLALFLSACVSFSGGSNTQRSDINPWASQLPFEWPPYQQSDADDLGLGLAPQGLLQEADMHYENGRMDASAAAIERALRLQPRSTVLWYRLAALKASQGQYEASNRLLEKARSLSRPDTSERIKQWQTWLSRWLLSYVEAGTV